jgi:hypothetical protein
LYTSTASPGSGKPACWRPSRSALGIEEFASFWSIVELWSRRHEDFSASFRLRWAKTCPRWRTPANVWRLLLRSSSSRWTRMKRSDSWTPGFGRFSRRHFRSVRGWCLRAVTRLRRAGGRHRVGTGSSEAWYSNRSPRRTRLATSKNSGFHRNSLDGSTAPCAPTH